MKAYLAQIRMNLRLTLRDRPVLFFSYLFPLIFFFMFGQMMHAEQGGNIAQIVNMVLSIGILGTGFFGAGMRAVADREMNILRRFKVAPITAAPIMISALITGLLQYLPLVVLVLALAHLVYGMPVPRHLFSLFAFVSLGVLAFRSLGGMIAAVVNSMQESQVIIQLLYLPMLFLSGVTFPLSVMPDWLQTVAQFLPATHLSTGLRSILVANESIAQNLPAAGSLCATILIATFLGVELFRWEKEEKMRTSAKLWLVAVLAPFLIMGLWQSRGKTNLLKEHMLSRQLNRNRTLLIRNARLFLGDGKVIEQGAVLVKNGKINGIYEAGETPNAKTLKAEEIDGAGKTLLPGLIDAHVHLAASGGSYESPQENVNVDQHIDRELIAYLFNGVTTVKSAGDPVDAMLAHRAAVNSGEKLGAELFTVGPMFTAANGHGTEYAQFVPEMMRAAFQQQLVRLPQSPVEAQKQVAALKAQGVDGIKAILESSAPFTRLDSTIFQAIAKAARANGLPMVVHTGNAYDVRDALDAGVDGVEHGSFRDEIPSALFQRMKQMGVHYDPTLAVVEAFQAFAAGDPQLLDRTLVQQTGPADLLRSTRKSLWEKKATATGARPALAMSQRNLLEALRAGVPLAMGTDSGNPLMIHGPGIHRELQLWVQAGVPPSLALQAATFGNAQLLRVDNRMGLIRQGYEASLVLVDGNPLMDITVTERVSEVIFKGERLNRTELFNP